MITKDLVDKLEIELSTFVVTLPSKLTLDNVVSVAVYLMEYVADFRLKGENKKKLVIDTLTTFILRTETLQANEKEELVHFVTIALPQTIDFLVLASKKMLKFTKKTYNSFCVPCFKKVSSATKKTS